MEPNFEAHLFICTNDRGPDGKRASCAHRGSEELRSQVKKACQGLGRVRINSSGCLDQCEHGIAAVLYPSGKWFLDLKEKHAEMLVEAVKSEVEKSRG